MGSETLTSTTAEGNTEIGALREVPITSGYRLAWLIWAVLLGTSFVSSAGWIRTLDGSTNTLRVASSVVLSITAWTFLVLSRRSSLTSVSSGIALGMSLGCCGDAWSVFFSRLLPVPPLLVMMLLFGLGHVAYIIGLLLVPVSRGSWSEFSRIVNWLVWFVIGLVGWWFTIIRGHPPAGFQLPSLLYTLLLATTAATATDLARVSLRWLLVGLGASLFFVSDLILAFETFHGHFMWSSQLVWLTYGPGQMLIVFGSIHAIDAMRFHEANASASATSD